MIVKYSDIENATCDDIKEMRAMCFEHKEMFCVLYDKSNLRKDIIEYTNINDLNFSRESFKAICLADMVLYQDRDGRIREIKTRFSGYNKLQLVGNKLLPKK